MCRSSLEQASILYVILMMNFCNNLRIQVRRRHQEETVCYLQPYMLVQVRIIRQDILEQFSNASLVFLTVAY